jgi:hypothetical protein
VIAMASKVRVDVAICAHQTTITAHDLGDGHVQVDIESDCPNVAQFARALRTVDMDDLVDWKDNRLLKLAADSGLTTTCLVPTAVFNCCWTELGMISKRFAMDKGPLCIHFVE